MDEDIVSKITQFLEDDRNVELLKTFSGFMRPDGNAPPCPPPSDGGGERREETSDGCKGRGRDGGVERGERMQADARGGAAGALFGFPSDMDAGRLMQALRRFGGTEDDRVRLLRALRPFMSEKRRESLDSVAKILRLTQVISLLGENMELF